MSHSPTIINQTNYTIVVFQDRGILYNKQVLNPGEAVSINKKETKGLIVPYQVHAVLGDERYLPTKKQSFINMVSTAAIPTAFVVGTVLTASSAGVLTGPSLALGPLVSGLVVNGIVVDAAAIVGGGIMASHAGMIGGILVKKHPDIFMTKSKAFIPGKRFLVVRGGYQEGPVEIEEISYEEFEKLAIQEFKSPFDTVNDKVKYYLRSTKIRQKVETI